MSKNLVIVESPAKAKTIEKYLGKDFGVLASYGHVRDLVPKEGAVDPENDFEMKYEIIEKNEKHVNAITKALKKSEALYLATDPDREGEAISWHLHELLKDRGLLEGKDVYRVVFHEITKNAVKNAVANPRKLSDDLINAQLARRALDYLVGFNLSPLLWKKIKRGLSAGRVQSPALRLLCEREAEIEKFIPQEYWTIEGDCEQDKQEFLSKLSIYKDNKLKQFDINNEKDATEAKQLLEKNANGKLVVKTVDKKERVRNPAAPFITSTMQQEAVRKLRFSAQKAMRVAQQLYEGIDLGEGAVGLITYMRTDSVVLAQEALDELRTFIGDRYGKNNLPNEVRVFKTKSKNAQEAHEAIRPTSFMRTPDDVKSFLSTDQLKLYTLIWKRAVASQMIHATLNLVAVEFECGEGNIFRATGSSIKTPGFMQLYLEGSDDKKEEADERMLPALEVGESVKLNKIRAEQHFTEPPPRFTEASLVKTLEEYGIGRPSTYASIISTLQYREYAEVESRRFTPTEMGRIVNDFLTKHFTQYVDYDFTARLEDDLDEISRGEKDWVPVLHKFWKPFNTLVIDKEESVTREEAVQARELGIDPKSGKPVSVRMGRYGPFVQIGTREDEDKPKFAGLLPGQKMADITYEQAMELFKLPRVLGETEEGEAVSASIGRFGPYVKYGSKYVSIKKDSGDDPYTIKLNRALELVAEKKKADAEKVIQVWEEEGIQILNGRYGPYVTDGNKNVKVPKETDPKSLDLEECQKMIAEAPEKKWGRKKKAAPKKKAAAKKKAPAKNKTATKKKKAASKKKKSTKKKAATKKSKKAGDDSSSSE
ncbi:MAG: DNA topoisomerase I [Gammaproteobacteria bacterium]|nr:DNA topoisomerase I [Gammaproteobacteria bacterium]